MGGRWFASFGRRRRGYDYKQIVELERNTNPHCIVMYEPQTPQTCECSLFLRVLVHRRSWFIFGFQKGWRTNDFKNFLPSTSVSSVPFLGSRLIGNRISTLFFFTPFLTLPLMLPDRPAVKQQIRWCVDEGSCSLDA